MKASTRSATSLTLVAVATTLSLSACSFSRDSGPSRPGTEGGNRFFWRKDGVVPVTFGRTDCLPARERFRHVGAGAQFEDRQRGRATPGCTGRA